MITARRLGRVLLLAAVIYFLASLRVHAQCVGCTWIDVGPGGQTLICTALEGGATYCEVQQP